nr:F box only protein 7 [Hymenolepis microstoma]
MRVNYAYVYGDNECSNTMQLAIKFSKFFIDPQIIDEDSRENVNVVFPNPQDLIVMLSDKLIEPILVDIHQALFLPPRFGFLSLRESEMLRICEILGLKDLGRLAATCRQMNRFINTSEVLWRRLTRNLLPAASNEYNSETIERVINEHGKCPSLVAFKNLYEVRISSLSSH